MVLTLDTGKTFIAARCGDAESFPRGDAVVGREAKASYASTVVMVEHRAVYSRREMSTGVKREYAIRSFSSSAEGGLREPAVAAQRRGRER